MSQLSIQFSQPCPCGGRTGHPHNRRTAIHEASKKHQRFIQSQKTTQTTPKSDGSSASSSPMTSSTAGKEC